jgi:hypothetical protein
MHMQPRVTVITPHFASTWYLRVLYDSHSTDCIMEADLCSLRGTNCNVD